MPPVAFEHTSAGHPHEGGKSACVSRSVSAAEEFRNSNTHDLHIFQACIPLILIPLRLPTFSTYTRLEENVAGPYHERLTASDRDMSL
ncbi:hypothetical protein E2C01_077778 [Portunus trituberculatus]|uniref:Uncharacterized protein n=1 Tax=Portunus trituberculatus TaxID=210409 RepID=A0A5B7IMX4_PORTR|nr:hypothetical protein [Portunus trituberculatus]